LYSCSIGIIELD